VTVAGAIRIVTDLHRRTAANIDSYLIGDMWCSPATRPFELSSVPALVIPSWYRTGASVIAISRDCSGLASRSPAPRLFSSLDFLRDRFRDRVVLLARTAAHADGIG
jgi:hypothetical protein